MTLERLVASRRVLLCVGSGGVGKTTTAAALAVGAVLAQVLFVTSGGNPLLWEITSGIDRWKPLYFALLFAASFKACCSRVMAVSS